MLQENTSITSIDLSWNRNIGEEGWKALAKALEVSFVLFREGSVFFGYRPPGNPPFLTVLFVQVNTTITELKLESNGFEDAGAIALSEALKVSFCCFPECSPFSWLPPPR